MGTGSFSTSPTGGTGARGLGFFKFLSVNKNAKRLEKVSLLRKDTQDAFAKVAAGKGFYERFTSQGIGSVYKSIFKLKFEVLDRQQWASIKTDYGVDGG